MLVLSNQASSSVPGLSILGFLPNFSGKRHHPVCRQQETKRGGDGRGTGSAGDRTCEERQNSACLSQRQGFRIGFGHVTHTMAEKKERENGASLPPPSKEKNPCSLSSHEISSCSLFETARETWSRVVARWCLAFLSRLTGRMVVARRPP